jgi:hypothetical protein
VAEADPGEGALDPAPEMVALALAARVAQRAR